MNEKVHLHTSGLCVRFVPVSSPYSAGELGEAPRSWSLLVETLLVEVLWLGTLLVETLWLGSLLVETLQLGTLLVETLWLGTLLVETLRLGTLLVETLLVGEVLTVPHPVPHTSPPHGLPNGF